MSEIQTPNARYLRVRVFIAWAKRENLGSLAIMADQIRRAHRKANAK